MDRHARDAPSERIGEQEGGKARQGQHTNLVLHGGDGTLGAPVDSVSRRLREVHLIALLGGLDGNLGAEHHVLELIVRQIAELIDAHVERRLALAVTVARCAWVWDER